MQGAATQAMWGRRRGAATPQMPAAAAPLRPAARRSADCVARSSPTPPGMLVARALSAGLGACSKVDLSFCDRPLVASFMNTATCFFARVDADQGQRRLPPRSSVSRKTHHLDYEIEHIAAEAASSQSSRRTPDFVSQRVQARPLRAFATRQEPCSPTTPSPAAGSRETVERRSAGPAAARGRPSQDAALEPAPPHEQFLQWFRPSRRSRVLAPR